MKKYLLTLVIAILPFVFIGNSNAGQYTNICLNPNTHPIVKETVCAEMIRMCKDSSTSSIMLSTCKQEGYPTSGSSNSNSFSKISNNDHIAAKVYNHCISMENVYGKRYLKNNCNISLSVWKCHKGGGSLECDTGGQHFQGLELSLSPGNRTALDILDGDEQYRVDYFACKKYGGLTKNSAYMSGTNCK